MPELSARLRAARAYADLTQPQLARRIELGEVTYASSERGQRHVPRRERLAIAEATGVPMWFLEGGWDGWRSATARDEGEHPIDLDRLLPEDDRDAGEAGGEQP